jgi:hypothetical protein
MTGRYNFVFHIDPRVRFAWSKAYETVGPFSLLLRKITVLTAGGVRGYSPEKCVNSR